MLSPQDFSLTVGGNLLISLAVLEKYYVRCLISIFCRGIYLYATYRRAGGPCLRGNAVQMHNARIKPLGGGILSTESAH